MVDYRPVADDYLRHSSVEAKQDVYHHSSEQVMYRAERYKEGARIRERFRRLDLDGDVGPAGGPEEHQKEMFYEDQMRQMFTRALADVLTKEDEE